MCGFEMETKRFKVHRGFRCAQIKAVSIQHYLPVQWLWSQEKKVAVSRRECCPRPAKTTSHQRMKRNLKSDFFSFFLDSDFSHFT